MGTRPLGQRDELSRWWFVGVATVSAGLLMVLSRNVFLFWDDFVFLGQAREGELSWEHLTDPLFRHFSPVVRVVNLAVVGALPEHPWVILAVQCALLAGVASAVTWLMVSLYGRSVRGLVGCVVLAPSLTLLPLGNWWTAGINIMPALIGFYVSFGAMVQLLRGRSLAWAVPCLMGAALGVLDYELPMLLVGYLVAWLVLCGSRLTDQPMALALRRTWWVWLGVLAIDLAAAFNYRLNYYDEAPSPESGEVVQALGRSLVRTLVPTALGFHDPRSDWFSVLSLVLGCVVLAVLVGWLLTTRRGAWRGLVFAVGGWLLPTLALVLNRVSIFGVVVVDNAIYFHLPTVLFVIGVLEATHAPRRRPATVVPTARARLLLVPALLVPVAGYAWSAQPTSVYQLPVGASPDFAERARLSATERLAEDRPFAVVNSDVPGNVVPGIQTPFNRADRVLGVIAPLLVFDRPEEVLYRVDPTGALVPTTITWLETTPGTGVVRFQSAPDREPGPEGSTCFTATDETEALWTLPGPAAATDLVVRTMAEVDETTSLRVAVRPEGAASGFERANPDEHTIGPEDAGVLDAVASPTVATIRVKGFTPGARVCLESIAIGELTP